MVRQHGSTKVQDFLNLIKKHGFIITKTNKGFQIIPPDKNLPIYNTHGTESAYHYLRRDFKTLYNFDISNVS
jgi:hypothetical protein